MKSIEKDVDWQFVIPENKDENLQVKILSGDFIDTIYRYNYVSFDEEDDGNVYLRFLFDVIESPFDKEALDSNMDFKNHIGDILTNIIEEKVKNDEIRTDHSEESDL